MADPTERQITFVTALLKQRGQQDLPINDYSKDEIRMLISALVEDGQGIPISPKQVDFIVELAEKLGYTADRLHLATLDGDQAGELIEWLKGLRLRERIQIFEEVMGQGRSVEVVANERGLTPHEVHAALEAEVQVERDGPRMVGYLMGDDLGEAATPGSSLMD